MNPRLRAIRLEQVEHQGQQGFVLSDPLALSDRVLFVPAALGPLLVLMDGSRDAGALRSGFELRTGVPLSPAVVGDVISQLDAALFLDNDRFARAVESVTREYRKAASRPPVMAGRSCPEDPRELGDVLDGYLEAGRKECGPPGGPGEAGEVRGVISPHIDFARGGPVYGVVWAAAAAAVREAELMVFLGTDHSGGAGRVTVTRQSYETPWGVVRTDREVVDRIAALAGEDEVFSGELRHRGEHSVEAALIWAHSLIKEKPCPVVPALCGSLDLFMGRGASPADSASVAATIEVLREAMGRRRTVVVAAADLAHVGPAFGDLLPLDPAGRARLEAQDRRLMEVLRVADPEAFWQDVARDGDQRRICGIPPIYIMLAALAGMKGTPAGYAQCPASPDGTSIVSICGMVYRGA